MAKVRSTILKYIVKKIMEPDYGCEERPEGDIAMDHLILRDESGQEIDFEVADQELFDKDINEGDWVYFDLNNVIFKE